ncbi:hypothetical protein C8R44DRAFT_856823 [Mycena epipterygia]|nr:hypothetical protein C8R44DRAFT_856823 [Mycena epipterygia]
MALTPQQKAAQTRTANKARGEQEALALQSSVRGPRNAKGTALGVQPWLDEKAASKKRAAAEASESTKTKQAKKDVGTLKPTAKAQRHLPPEIDADSDKDNSAPALPAPVKNASRKTKSTELNPPSQGLRNPTALAKPVPPLAKSVPAPVPASAKPVRAPAPQAQADEEQSSEGEEDSRNSDELGEEEPEEDDDVDGDQLQYKTAQWVPDDDGEDHPGQQIDVDMNDHDADPGNREAYYGTGGYEVEMDAHANSAYRVHSRSGSVSSGYDAHIPTSASERESEFEDHDEEEVPRPVKGRSHIGHWRMDSDRRRPAGGSHITGRSLSQTTRMLRYASQMPMHSPRSQEMLNSRLGAVVVHRRHCMASRSSRRGNLLSTQHVSIASVSRSGRISSGNGVKTFSTRPHRKSESDPPPKGKAAKSKISGVSHAPRGPEIPTTRREKAIREQPVWLAEASHPASAVVQVRRSEARSMKVAVTLPSSGWPTTPTSVFTNRGVLNLGAQDSWIQNLIRNSFIKVTGDAIFLNDFPDVGDRLKYARDGLYSTSNKLGYNDISARLIADEVYSKEIAKVADSRWTDARRTFKTAAIPATIHAFDLKVGCSERVQALLGGPYNDYIYPIKDGAPDYSKPFGNPAIITTIHQAVFSGRRPLATVYQTRFPVTDGPQLERMIGKVIACIAATAVCATLQEWQGPVHLSNEFNANLFAETYQVHLRFLDQMEERSPVAYQKVLTRLYREASGQGKVVAPRAATGTNALAHLNFADLEAASD